MQQDADFITADFLYMFRALCAHHQEYKMAATGTGSYGCRWILTSPYWGRSFARNMQP